MDIMLHVGGYHDARGGYYEYRGGVQYRGGRIFTIVTPMDPLGTVWSATYVWDPPLKQLPSQQQIKWHYVWLRMGPIYKVFLGSFLSVVTADLSGII